MTDHTHQSLLVFGAGNMGKSVVGGLLTNQWPADSITLCDIEKSRHASLQQQFPHCSLISSPNEMAHSPSVILLAVKPHDMKTLCQLLTNNDHFRYSLYITVAAGLPISAYQRWLGDQVKLVRCMPNTPAAVGLAMTGLYTSSDTSETDKALADQILNSIGATLWVNKESMLDAVTALSGSGPAYVFYLMECMQKGGQALGLSAEESNKLALQTLVGAAQLAKHQAIDFETLRANVTSKGGTTEQAINCFQQNNLNKIVQDALSAAAKRAEEISQTFDKE